MSCMYFIRITWVRPGIYKHIHMWKWVLQLDADSETDMPCSPLTAHMLMTCLSSHTNMAE